jgi:hypothetical protein
MKHLAKMRYEAGIEGVNITWCDIWYDENTLIQIAENLDDCDCEECKDNFFENGFNE